MRTMLSSICLALLLVLSPITAHADPYLFDFHFDTLTYLGNTYDAADIFYTAPYLTGDVEHIAYILNYVNGNVNGFSSSEMYFQGDVYADDAPSLLFVAYVSGGDPLEQTGLVQGFGFVFLLPAEVGVFPSFLDGGASRLLPDASGHVSYVFSDGYVTVTDLQSTTTIPETGTWMMVGTGVLGVSGFLRRSRWE